jgi:hypothetical protein
MSEKKEMSPKEARAAIKAARDFVAVFSEQAPLEHPHLLALLAVLDQPMHLTLSEASEGELQMVVDAFTGRHVAGVRTLEVEAPFAEANIYDLDTDRYRVLATARLEMHLVAMHDGQLTIPYTRNPLYEKEAEGAPSNAFTFIGGETDPVAEPLGQIVDEPSAPPEPSGPERVDHSTPATEE